MAAAVVSQKDINKIIKASVNNINVIIDSLVKNLDKLEDNDNADRLKENAEFIEEICGVINTYIKTIGGIMSTMPKMKFSNSVAKSNALALKNSIDLVILFVKLLDSEELKNIDKSMFKRIEDITEVFKGLATIFGSVRGMIGKSLIILTLGWTVKIAIKVIISIAKAASALSSIKNISEATENVNNLSKIIDNLYSIFSNIAKMIPLSLIVVMLGWVIIASVGVIIVISKVITKLIAIGISSKASKNIKDLRQIFDNLYSIMKTIVKMIPVSILAMAGIPLIILFVLTLVTVVLTINLLLKVTDAIDNKTRKNVRGINRVFKALISVCVSAIILALIVPVAAFAMVMIVLPFLIFMASFFIIMSIAMFLIRKLSVFSRNQMIIIAFNVLLIVAIFIIMCLAIYLAYVAGTIVMKEGMLLTIVVGLIAIGIMFMIILGIGKVISKSIKFLRVVSTAIVPLVQILGYMGAIVVAIIVLGGLGYLIVEHDLGTYAAAGLVAVAVVMGATLLAAKAIAKSSTFVLKTRALILPLIKVLGLIGLLSLSIVILGITGVYVVENVTHIVAALTAIITILMVVLKVAKTISSLRLAPTFDKKVLSLIKVMGLLGMVALAIVAFGLVGMFLEQNLGYVIGGLIAIVVVSSIVIGLGKLLSKAKITLTKTTAAVTPLLIVLGLFVAAALAIVLFGETGKYLEQNLEYVIGGLIAIIIVAAIVVGLGMLLTMAAPLLGATIAATTPLLIVLGLFVAAALSIIIFGETAKYLEKNLGYVIGGLIAIVIVSAIIVGLGMLLSLAAPLLGATIAVSIPLLIVLGLFLAAALAIVLFAETGKFLEQNMQYVVTGFVAITVVTLSIIALGVLLGIAIIPLGLATIGGILLIAVMGLLLAVGALIEEFAETDLTGPKDIALGNIGWIALIVGALIGLSVVLLLAMIPFALITVGSVLMIASLALLIAVEALLEEFAETNLDPIFGKISGNILIIGLVGGELVLLGASMVIIAAGCAILTVLITPLLVAIAEVTLAAKSIEELGKLEINEAKVNKNINSISSFWDAFKNLMSKFSIKDLLTFDDAEELTRMMRRVANSVKGIAESIVEISNLEIDSKPAIDVVTKVFEVVTKLAELLKELLNGELADSPLFEVPEQGFFAFFKQNKKPTAKDKLNNVTKIVYTIKSVTDALMEITKYKFTSESTAELVNTIESIFKVIETIAKQIEKVLEKTDVFNDKIVMKSTWWGGKKKVVEKNTSIEKLDNVSKICEVLNAITQTLNEIQKITLNEKKITDTVDYLFNFIKELSVHIANCLADDSPFDTEMIETSTWWGGLKYEESEPKALKQLDCVTQITSMLAKMTESLNSIQKLNINKELVIGKVNSLFEFVNIIGDHIRTNMHNFKLFDDETKMVARTVEEGGFLGIGSTTTTYMEPVVVENQLAKNVAGYEQVMSSVIKMIQSFEALSKIELNEDIKTQVANNMNQLFDFARDLVFKIDTFLDFERKNSMFGEEAAIGSEKTIGYILKERSDEYSKSIKTISEMVNCVKEALDALMKINELAFNEKVKGEILGKIDLLFNSTDEIMTKISTSLTTLNSSNYNSDTAILNDIAAKIDELIEVANRFNDIDLDKFRKSKPVIISFLKDLSTLKFNTNNNLDNVLTLLKEVETALKNDTITSEHVNKKLDFLERLNDITKKVNTSTFKNVKTLMVGFLKELAEIKFKEGANNLANVSKIVESIFKLTYTGIDTKKIKLTNDRLNHLERLSKVIQSLALLKPAQVKQSKQLINDQINYLKRINSTDINKLKTTAKMLGSMASLSASIRGNFQGLAKTLNQEIAPLLETLKKLLEDIKRNVGTTNTGGGAGRESNSSSSSSPNPSNTGNNSGGGQSGSGTGEFLTYDQFLNNSQYTTNPAYKDLIADGKNEEAYKKYRNNASASNKAELRSVILLLEDILTVLENETHESAYIKRN